MLPTRATNVMSQTAKWTGRSTTRLNVISITGKERKLWACSQCHYTSWGTLAPPESWVTYFSPPSSSTTHGETEATQHRLWVNAGRVTTSKSSLKFTSRISQAARWHLSSIDFAGQGSVFLIVQAFNQSQEETLGSTSGQENVRMQMGIKWTQPPATAQ